MKQETVVFRAKVGTGQAYTKGGFLYFSDGNKGIISSISFVESNLKGEVFVVGRHLPQVSETTE